MTTLTSTHTLADLVAEKPSRAKVLERYGLDYCCGGTKSLEAACRELGKDWSLILSEICAHDRLSPADAHPDGSWPLGRTIQHILDVHHVYLQETLPRLVDLAARVRDAHAVRHPELQELGATIRRLKDELIPHMMKEEQVLFPMARALEAAGGPLSFHCGSVANPIQVMEMEHESTGEVLRKLRALTNSYSVPADACASYRSLMDRLRELEEDIHRHIFEENHLLFPKIKAREADLWNQIPH